MSVIGRLLCMIRQEHGLTQEQFVHELATLSSEFKALNAVTLSRWETGATSTSFKKKRELFKIFALQGWLQKNPCHEFVRNRFENLCAHLVKIFDHNYQTLIANVPKLRIGLDEYDLHDLQQRTENYFYENIIDIERASNPGGYYAVTPGSLQKLCRYSSSFSLVCERKKQHLGHFVMFKLNNEDARDLVHNQINENDISRDNLCGNTEKGTYYIHALYGVNPTIAALLNTHAYLYLFDNMDTIDNIAIFSSRIDGMRLAKAYGIKTVASGKNTEHDFSWHGMQSPVEEILFSDTVLKLIF